MAPIRCLLLVWFAAGVFSPLAAQIVSPRPTEWYAVNQDLNDKNQTLTLGTGSHSVSLKTGDVCTISDVSINNARQVVCVHADQSVSFSVQCDSQRPKDHTQLRFRRTGSSTLTDFIEVGCLPSAK